MKQSRYEMDMCSGSLPGKILLFSLPLMASGLLQLLFNAADIAVVGKFVGSDALAAVGSNGPMVNLIVNLFLGFSVGASALVARYYGAQEYDKVSDVTHTAMALGLIGGVVVMIVGAVLAHPILVLMDTPPEVLPLSSQYLFIYFLGMPGLMLYNFGAAILRGVGDTRRPLFYLTIAGFVNVGLNLVLVIVFHMGVAGVAIATAASQYVSAGLVLNCMFRTPGYYQLSLRLLKIYQEHLLPMARIGIPAGMQGAIFSLSNMFIQSSINSFGNIVMAGCAAAFNLEGFVMTCINSLGQAGLTFASQNLGAKQYHRLRGITFWCVLLVLLFGEGLGYGIYYFGTPLIGIYDKTPAVVAAGLIHLSIVSATCGLDGLMGVLASIVRGMEYSVLPMIVTLVGACGLRVLWILTVFAAYPTLEVLLFCYPVSWIITSLVHFICYFIIKRKIMKQAKEEAAPAA